MALNILLAILLVAIGWLANALGLFLNALILFVAFSFAFRLIGLCIQPRRRLIDFGIFKSPGFPKLSGLEAQVFTRWLFWIATAVIIRVCLVPTQFTPGGAARILLTCYVMLLLLLISELFPARKPNFPLNGAMTLGWVFIAAQLIAIYGPSSKEDVVRLFAPFRGQWVVVQGGNSSLVNHHHGVENQRNAIDLNRVSDGVDRVGDRKLKESYLAWGQILYSPADGTVVAAVNEYDDNNIGQADRKHPAGNYIVIDIGRDKFVLMGHIMKGSILVKSGDRVHVGEALARCGNSGNTASPHLHIQVQDTSAPLVKGGRTFPIVFLDAKHIRSGRELRDTWAILRRNDYVVPN
jgi:hypothetical protein